jgi:hypothetical protein
VVTAPVAVAGQAGAARSLDDVTELPDISAAAPRPGRALLLYSALRIALLVVAFAVLRVIVGPGQDLFVVGGAVLLSALLSLVLLRRQRDAFTSAAIARSEQRRAVRERRRARLDESTPED